MMSLLAWTTYILQERIYFVANAIREFSEFY